MSTIVVTVTRVAPFAHLGDSVFFMDNGEEKSISLRPELKNVKAGDKLIITLDENRFIGPVVSVDLLEAK